MHSTSSTAKIETDVVLSAISVRIRFWVKFRVTVSVKCYANFRLARVKLRSEAELRVRVGIAPTVL